MSKFLREWRGEDGCNQLWHRQHEVSSRMRMSAGSLFLSLFWPLRKLQWPFGSKVDNFNNYFPIRFVIKRCVILYKTHTYTYKGPGVKETSTLVLILQSPLDSHFISQSPHIQNSRIILNDFSTLKLCSSRDHKGKGTTSRDHAFMVLCSGLSQHCTVGIQGFPAWGNHTRETKCFYYHPVLTLDINCHWKKLQENYC